QHTSPPAIYPLPLHDALPIFFGHANAGMNKALFTGFTHYFDSHYQSIHDSDQGLRKGIEVILCQSAAITASQFCKGRLTFLPCRDRKSTRLNSSHVKISYAVF